MLCEASGVGATLRLEAIPRPDGIPWATWLQAFPSYGFLLAARPSDSARAVRGVSRARDIAAAVAGRFDASRQLALASGDAREVLWDLADGAAHRVRRRPRDAGPRVSATGLAAYGSVSVAGAAAPARPAGAAGARGAAPDPPGHAPPGRGRPVRELAVPRRRRPALGGHLAELGLPTDEIRSESGERIYPTVVAVRARYDVPLARVRENDHFEAAAEVVPAAAPARTVGSSPRSAVSPVVSSSSS